MNDIPLQIAIDGPVASGKGEIASLLAKKFNLIYVYTGAMYRALALACIRAGIPCKDEQRILALLPSLEIAFAPVREGDPYPYRMLLNGEDVSDRITSQDTAQGASDVGSIASVRAWMVARQQQIVAGKRVVMEGRDIGLRVLPDARFKIYLTASVEERAKRRFAQWQSRHLSTSYEETLKDTRIRDLQDSSRSTDPLQKLPDAWELDTTGMSVNQVIDRISEEMHNRKLL